MKWKNPPKIKIYEALGSVADGRVEISENKAKVWSSSRNKYYDVTYDSDSNAIMTNDNGSYWKGYLGYPAIAFLMKIGKLSYSEEMGGLLKNIAWKDLNQKYKNDFNKTLEEILNKLSQDQRAALESLVEIVEQEIMDLEIEKLGKRAKPPYGY